MGFWGEFLEATFAPDGMFTGGKGNKGNSDDHSEKEVRCRGCNYAKEGKSSRSDYDNICAKDKVKHHAKLYCNDYDEEEHDGPPIDLYGECRCHGKYRSDSFWGV